MPYGFSVPSTRITSYALRAMGGPGLGAELFNSNMLENSLPGTVIGTLACFGTIGTPVFSLIDDAAGRVALAGADNATVVAGLVPSDFEATPFFNFTVSITGVSPQLPNLTFTIYVLDVNEFAPVFVSHGGVSAVAMTITEGTTAVTTVMATDADGDVVTYSVAGPDASRFVIDPVTGVLAFAAPPDYENPLDVGANNEYVVIVVASDGEFTDTQTFTVTVEDVLDPVDTVPPVITSPASFSVFENATFTHTLTATDDTAVTWTKTGGADAGLFTLAGSSLSLAPKNFESPSDANTDNAYIVEVTATDTGGNTDTHTITVTVAAVNEFAPVITSNGGAATASIDVPENTVAVTTVVATDADNDAITYAITGGADAAKFAINPTTGVLTFISSPDYEAFADANADNAYIVIVQASDGASTDTQTITVNVTNVFDDVDTTPPIITSTNALALAENQGLALQLTASEDVTWTITGGADAALFSLLGPPPLTFLTWTGAAKNFESPEDANGDNAYIVQVTATDAALNQASQTITITVTNVNEFAPVITSNGGAATASIFVPENSTAVTTVTAADADAGAVIAYSITGGADAAKFTIGSTTGILAFVTAPDFDVPGSAAGSNAYIVIVQASDGTSTDTQTITVNVTDLAEDTTPDAFTFAPVTNAALNTVIESNFITVSGITAPATMVISGGEYQKNGVGAWATASTTVVNGNTVKVRGLSQNTNSAVTLVTLNIGGVNGSFQITTFGADTTPDAFTFAPATGQPISTLVESNAITVAGINAPAPMTISAGGQYQIGIGAWASSATNVVLGNSIKVRGTSSASFLTPVVVTLTIGGVDGTFTITTVASDTIPNAFTFADITNAALSVLLESTSITVTGINTSTPISITGGEYQKNGGGSWTAVSGTVIVNDTIKVRRTSSATPSTPVDVVLTIGTVSDTFTITTVAPLDVPILDLATASDTGSSTADNITTNTVPDVLVTLGPTVVAGDKVRILDGVTELTLHTITAGEIGSSSIALGLDPLTEGSHSLTARHERGTLLSSYSTALVITVDVTLPVITTPATANVDEGLVLAIPLTVSGGDTVTWTETLDATTSGNHFEISGTTLRWTSNGTKAFTGVVDAYSCTVRATDVAGNATDKIITVTVQSVALPTTRSFGAEGIGITGAIGGKTFGAEGVGIKES